MMKSTGGRQAVDTVTVESIHAALQAQAQHRLIKTASDILSGSRSGFDVRLVHEMPIYRLGAAPGSPGAGGAAFQSDRNDFAFEAEGRIAIPRLLHLFEENHVSGKPYTDVMVNVKWGGLVSHPESHYDVELYVYDELRDHRIFHRHYGQHQFFIPLGEFVREVPLALRSRCLDEISGADPRPSFQVQLFVVSRPAILERLASSSVWIFSSARSGSTWLAGDLLGKTGAPNSWRTIDESGIGRMYAPTDWAAERFYDLAADWRSVYVESGFEFEAYIRDRSMHYWKSGTKSIPVFERVFHADMMRENQLFSRRNYDFYHASLRRTALEHVLHEWGCRDYERLIFKCPNDSQAADFIVRAFPEAFMIFLMRDGRDVMKSRFSKFGSGFLATTNDPDLRRYAISFFSHFWNFQVDIMRDAHNMHPPERRIFVKYEDLRKEPYASMKRILDSIGIEIEDERLAEIIATATLENIPAQERGTDKPRQSGTVGGYAAFFTAGEIDLMNNIMGENLRRYGYL
jgi:hypothetical protein